MKFEKRLKKLRIKIEKIDRKLVGLVAERMRVVKKIGKLKKEFGRPIFNKKREEEVLKMVSRLAKRKGIDIKLTKKIFKLILSFSKKLQCSN